MWENSLRSILIATDLSPFSDTILRQAAALAAAGGADLHVLHVVAGPAVTASGAITIPVATLREAESLLDAQLRRCAPDAAIASREVRAGVPHATIAVRRGEVAADLIVIGPHGGSRLRARVLGTTADRVLREADVPCLVVRREAPLPWTRIGVPTDLRAPTGSALATAVRWTERFPAGAEAVPQISLVHVGWEVERESDPHHATRLTAALEREAERARAAGAQRIRAELLWATDPADRLVSWARRRRLDLLVVPTSGEGVVRRAILGSTSSALARTAPCPVLLVPAVRGSVPSVPGLDRLVLGADFTGPSSTAIEWVAAHLAPDAEHVLVHAIDVMQPPPFLDHGAAAREQLIEGARLIAENGMRDLTRRTGMKHTRVEIREGRAHEVLDEVAAEVTADVIVVGDHTHPRGISRVLGTTAERLIRCGTAPVLLVRGAPEGPPRRILAAVDASSHADPVLAWARYLAARHGAGLGVFHALSPDFLGRARLVSGIAAGRKLEARYREQGEAWLRDRLARIAGMPADVELLVPVGDAAYEILAAQLRDGFDLVVLGSRGEGALARGLLGSVATRVLHGATCPVLVVRDAAGRSP